MAQILIRKRKHPAEDAKPPGWSDVKWAGRTMRGDVVEVQPDGFFRIEALGPSSGAHGWDRNAFALIEVVGLSLKDAGHLHRSYTVLPDTPEDIMKKTPIRIKNRYRFDKWDKIEWIKNTVEVNGVIAEEWYCRCDGFGGAVVVADKVS